MNDVTSYRSSNQKQQRDTTSFLNEYSSKFMWKKDKIRVLDIGCGDGGVTTILQKYIPSDDYTLLGCDVNEKMVNYANSHHGNKRVSFMVLDIQGDLPEGFKESFDHVFSFYTLHWILNIERAFTNIYELLSGGGECFMIFIAGAPVLEVYRILARSHKWNSLVRYWERHIELPFNELKKPEEPVRKLMENIGFTNINVVCKELAYTYENMDHAKMALKSICPFQIPDELCNDFMDDYIEAAKGVDMFNSINNGDNVTLEMKYRLFIVHARK